MSQITSLTIVYSTLYSGADQRKHQSFASLAFVRGIHRSLVNASHKGPVMRKMFPFDDVIMTYSFYLSWETTSKLRSPWESVLLREVPLQSADDRNGDSWWPLWPCMYVLYVILIPDKSQGFMITLNTMTSINVTTLTDKMINVVNI